MQRVQRVKDIDHVPGFLVGCYDLCLSFAVYLAEAKWQTVTRAFFFLFLTSSAS